MYRSVVTSLAVVVLAAWSVVSEAPLYLLDDPTARCLDGTPGGYYFRPAQGAENQTKWIIHLQGGGECTTKTRCLEQLTNPLGSSKYFTNTTNLGFFSLADPYYNPEFYTYNAVLVAYCTQDLWSGTVTQPSEETYGLYFAGHHVFKATLNDLIAKHSLGDASEIILSGDSAGGIGAFLHFDYIASMFPKARTVGAPIAGFYYYAYPYQGVNHTSSGLADFREPAWPGHIKLWQSFMNHDCVTALHDTPWACMLGNYSHPYVKTPLFVTESQNDKVVLLYHDWIPQDYVWGEPEQDYLTEWRNNMTQGLSYVTATGTNGIFNPACFLHTGFNDDYPIIEGLNYRQAFASWYFGRPGSHVYQDHCGNMCNPACPEPAKPSSTRG